MAEAQWRFRKMQHGEINRDPMERELFAAETANERLVREAVQNSLDAALSRADRAAAGPVRMRFSLRGVHSPLDALDADAYAAGLEEHLQAGLEPSDDFRKRVALRGLANDGMPYIVIEDVGTVGLEGDWRQYDDSAEEPADDNHFYWFFRNVGRSGKSDLDGGSWGLGKWVFPDASHASAYIAVTRRRSDGETLLMGQAVLTKHNIDGQRYDPYGYFGEEDEGGLMLPLRSSNPAHRTFIQQCIADFDLRLRDEPGLSVIIPFPRVDADPPIDRQRIIEAVVHNYFYPIIAGRLEVTVDDGDADFTEVTADTIDDVLARLPLEDGGERSVGSYQRLFEMCREAAALSDHEHIALRSPPRNVASYEHHEMLAGLRSRHENGEMLAFRIGMSVERKETGRKEPTSFRLYVQHDDSLTQGHDFYVRGDLSITDMDFIGRRKARTLLVADESEPLAALLRDSEPPAHTMWYPRSERVGKRWTSARHRINEVRNAANNLLSIWDAAPVELQRDALAAFFPASGHGAARRRGTKGKPAGNRERPDMPPSHPDFDVHQSGTGFRARFAPDVAAPPGRVRLRVAYEAPRGNPLNGYSPHDFRLHGQGALDVRLEGCQATPGDGGNELLLEIAEPERFSVAVQGFDKRRDLHVRVERLADAAQSEGADDDPSV